MEPAAQNRELIEAKIDRARRDLRLMRSIYRLSPPIGFLAVLFGTIFFLLAVIGPDAQPGPMRTATLFLAVALFGLGGAMAWVYHIIPRTMRITRSFIAAWREGDALSYDIRPLRALQFALILGGAVTLLLGLISARTNGVSLTAQLIVIALGLAGVASGLWSLLSSGAHPGYQNGNGKE